MDSDTVILIGETRGLLYGSYMNLICLKEWKNE